MNGSDNNKGVIAWFARNHVAANLMMLTIIVFGVISLINVKQEVFPEVDLDQIQVSVVYLGASPEEVEEAICTKIEEQVASIEGVDTITSRASEGVGSVIVELEKGSDTQQALDDIKAEVDRITTFPEEAEEPQVSERTNRRQVINLVVYGDVDERTLKVLAERARNDLTALPNISQAELSGTRDYQISIEVSEGTLRRYGITFDQVVGAVRSSSLDLPGGSIKNETGEILIRTKGQRYTGDELERIIVITRPDGTTIELGDIARVVDGFDEDATIITRFDGKPAAMVQVFRVAEQDALDVAGSVKDYIDSTSEKLPVGVEMGVWRDRTEILKSRRDLLIRNGRVGLLLVFICLAMFLNLRLAFWVMLGIPISFMGALWLIPSVGSTINMISLFAFIVSLGIVVDDAIVVGENIYTHWEEGKPPLKAAIDGAKEMAKPVTFAVLTTVAAFSPLLYVDGNMGKFMWQIPVVVIAVLLMSLIESLLILPAHLSTLKGNHHNHEEKKPWPLERLRRVFGRGLEWFIRVPYSRLLDLALRWRYLTLAVFVAMLLITYGWVAGGRIQFLFFPKVESDFVQARLAMPRGTSLGQTWEIARSIEMAARQLQEEYSAGGDHNAIRHIYAVAGGQSISSGPIASSPSGTHLAEVSIQLVSSEERTVTANQISTRWRELVGPVAGADSLTFSSTLFHSGSPLQVRLTAEHFDQLRDASRRLKERLALYPGVSDIEDSFREGKMELKLTLKPAARTFGLTLADLARQVRQGYQGEEAVRIQRGRDDVKVVVRYPLDERSSLGDLERMRIRTPAGDEIPFSQVADVDMGRSYATINRQERQRVITVTADLDDKVANSKDITEELAAGFLPRLMADYPAMGYNFEGRAENRRESLESLRKGFIIAMFVIYALLAIPFGAYLQPLVVMSAIPFGIIGAVWGHVLMGMPMTILSMFGLVALSGVVVNDSLIMVDFINRSREKGMALREAVLLSGKKRFRPIMLTTLTTFFGLLPLLLEKSVQAQFLIPMALSLAFGIVAATTITLILIPILYTVMEDAMWMIGYQSDRWTNGSAEE